MHVPREVYFGQGSRLGRTCCSDETAEDDTCSDSNNYGIYTKQTHDTYPYMVTGAHVPSNGCSDVVKHCMDECNLDSSSSDGCLTVRVRDDTTSAESTEFVLCSEGSKAITEATSKPRFASSVVQPTARSRLAPIAVSPTGGRMATTTTKSASLLQTPHCLQAPHSSTQKLTTTRCTFERLPILEHLDQA